jgi:nucleotide-binding universal stress UspA family protein
MTTYRSVLVPFAADPRAEACLRVAVRLALAFEARLTGLFVDPELAMPAPFDDPAAFGGADLAIAQRRHVESRARRAAEVFETVCREEAGIDHVWQRAAGDPGAVIAELARLHDLVVMGQSQAEGVRLAPQVPERVVLESGRPTLMIPYAGVFERVGGRILVAWNGTREAARAVADTLPLLVRAEQVVVLEIDLAEDRAAPGSALVAHLRRHGAKAEARHTVSAGIALGEILLSAVADAGSDLLVMGAYGHSRVRELALGGVTRTVLEEMTIPVVMSY